MNVREELFALKEEKYKLFIEKLIPNCNNILGIRMPALRKLAKEIVKSNSHEEYLNEYEDIYFEETMIKGLVIGLLKDDKEKITEYINVFVPKITNWSLCDSFCNSLKQVNKDKEYYLKLIKKYSNSQLTYDIRFALVTLTFHYIEEQYLEDIFRICNSIKSKEYYVQMAIAWLISMCYVKYPDITINYLNNNNLDDFTYNKSLQKIMESLQIDKSTKEMIKSMKRK